MALDPLAKSASQTEPAFVARPDDCRRTDNGKAGLAWEVSEDCYFREICPTDSVHWGVWGVSFPHAKTSHTWNMFFPNLRSGGTSGVKGSCADNIAGQT